MKQLLSLTPVLMFFSLIHPALAQQESLISKEKKIYAGLQWTQGRYEVLYPAKDVGVQSMTNLRYTLGYWMWPRLAFQTSFMRDQETINETDYGTTDTGVPTSQGFVNVQTCTAIPFLLRYTLTRKPSQRVQFDVLGGATLVFAKYTLDYVNTEANVVTRTYHREEQAAGTVRWTAGLGGRCKVFHRLEITADATWSQNPKLVSYNQHASKGNRWGITKAVSLGLNYPFSLSKRKPDTK